MKLLNITILCFILTSLNLLPETCYSQKNSLLDTRSKFIGSPRLAHPEPEEKKKEDWDLNVSFGFNATQGNIVTRLLTAQIDAKREINKNIYKFLLTGSEGEQDDQLTQRFVRSNASYDRLISKKTFLGSGFTFIKDDIAEVDYRAITDLGIGYFLFKSDDFKFSVETGPAYVFEEQNNFKDNYLAYRVANDISFNINEHSRIYQVAEFILNTENTDEFFIIAKTGLQTSITDNLSLILSVEDRFDNDPAENRKRNDIITSTSLSINF